MDAERNNALDSELARLSTYNKKKRAKKGNRNDNLALYSSLWVERRARLFNNKNHKTTI